MDSPSNKTRHPARTDSPRTIRKKSLAPFDRHILNIDRSRYELSPSTSSNQSRTSYQSSLEETLLKKKSLKEFAIQRFKPKQTHAQEGIPKNRSCVAVRNLRVNEWRDNYYANLLDWSHTNFICVGVHNSLLFYNMAIHDELESSPCRHYRFQKQEEDINSLKFAPANTLIGIAYDTGKMLIFDYFKEKTALSKKAHHSSRIAAVQWHGSVLLTGGKDSLLKAVDAKSGKQCMKFEKRHSMEICGLKSNGNLLASGGNDNLVCIYDIRKPGSLLGQYSHKAAIKALDWTKSSILLSGGGVTDGKMKFWRDGPEVFKEIDTGSQVCGIKASINSQEIVTCQGYSLNQIIVWSNTGRRELTIHAHSDRVLYCALSPSGEHLATGAGDQTMKIWRIFPKQEEDMWGLGELR